MKYYFCLCVLLVATSASADVVGHHERAHELLLSGDGRVAFSSGGKETRVWDVAGKRELPRLPIEAGRVVAVDKNGGRVLCRRSERGARQEFDLVLWWRPRSIWQKGTRVRGASIQPLLDATFVGDEVVLLWEQRIERLDARGRLRRTVRLKNLKRQVPVGALSPDGTRAVASGDVGEQLYAFVYDGLTGRRLTQMKLDSFNSYTA